VTPRITLSRIVAVNWYGYRQFIDVGGLTLITGANGSGKSALLDLIQFVLLGENLSRFNKAAAGAGSGRTLRGYCLCDTNTHGRDGQERFVRSSGVTIAALEFEFPPADPASAPRRQTWGARVEFDSPTAKGRTLWFQLPARLKREDFLREDDSGAGGEFLPEDEFRVRLRRDLDGECWEHQRTYLEEMKQRSALHFDREQMNKTLPKAMAFQPESNFEAFIRDYLLEAGLPDVRAVKESVDAHRRAKERLDKMRDQHARLVSICELHAAGTAHRREAALWAHLRDALAHEEAVERLHADETKLRALIEENKNNLLARKSAVAERDHLRERLDEVRTVIGQDSQIARLSEEREKLAKLEREIDTLRDARDTARGFLRDHFRDWKDWLAFGEKLGAEAPEAVHAGLESLNGPDEARALAEVAGLSREAGRMVGDAMERLRELEESIRTAARREAGLAADLENYRNDRTAAAPLLEALRGAGLDASAFGRSVEVKPSAESWWPLLETLLSDERQAVLVEDFRAAWEIARHTGTGGDEPLVNPDELTKAAAKPLPGSLRDFFDTKDPMAAAYLAHLLGRIMPVEDSSRLDAHERALSRDGWLKDPPRRVFLRPARELTLGAEGLRRLREMREGEIRAVRNDLRVLRQSQSDWRSWVERAERSNLVHPVIPAVGASLQRLPDAEKERAVRRETVRLLSTPEREKAVAGYHSLVAEEHAATERATRLDERLKFVDQSIRELQEKSARSKSEEAGLATTRKISRAGLPASAEDEIASRIEAARNQFASWPKRVEAAIQAASTAQVRAAAAAAERDEARRRFLAAHPEIAGVFDPAEEDNDQWERRREELGGQELERFQAEAERARAEWEDRLQHQVLDVLRDKINEAERTKRELNRAMNHDIGGICYQIVSRRDRAHSAIWTLVEKGLPTGDDMGLFNAAQQADIERAKQELMAAIDAVDEPGDNNGCRALDYRFYHRWDIEARPAGRGDEAAISLNRSAKKQSGGENQAPFFVATLAAFHRVYDTGSRGTHPSLGLVVMDEAFSKLSGDRIDDCLALARNFGLQLVMAFPEDRLPTMIAHADTVIQCRVERAYHEKSGAVNHIENWVVRVNRDRLRHALRPDRTVDDQN